MHPGSTMHPVQTENCIILVKDVPCSQCSQCGVVSYSGSVALKLEEIVANLEKSLTEIAVVSYPTV
jgi:YgiT-type zinc finger domain-containing protein